MDIFVLRNGFAGMVMSGYVVAVSSGVAMRKKQVSPAISHKQGRGR